MGANGGYAGTMSTSANPFTVKVLENAGSVEEIEDDVVMAEHDSDEELPAEELAEEEPEIEEGGGTIFNRPVSCHRHQMDHSR